MQFSFEKLEAYQESVKLVEDVYKLVDKFPDVEKFSLANQLHRAIVSIPSNIAESCGRSSLKEKIHFVEISYGSLLESFCQLQIARNLNYIAEEDIFKVQPRFFTVSRLLNGLRNSYSSQLNKPLNH